MEPIGFGKRSLAEPVQLAPAQARMRGYRRLRHNFRERELPAAMPALDNHRFLIEIERPLNPYITGKFRFPPVRENTEFQRPSE